MKKVLPAALYLFAALIAFGQGIPFPGGGMTHAVGVASPTISQKCPSSGNQNGTTPINVVCPSDLLANDRIVVYIVAFNGTPSVSGCSLTWTIDTQVGNTTQATSSAASAGACTPVVTGASGLVSAYALVISGSSGVDVRGVPFSQGSITTGNAFNCAQNAITTTVDGCLIICGAMDPNGNGGSYTNGATYTTQHGGTANNYGTGVESFTQTTAGSIQMTWASYSVTTSPVTASVAFKP